MDVIRRGRAAETLRVTMTQGERLIMDATVAVAADNDGLEHAFGTFPDVPQPEELPSRDELVAELDEPRPSFPFWDNFEVRPIDFRADWPPPGPEDPVVRQWQRFAPRATFDDPWVDVGRYLLLCDLPSWPAAMRHHAWRLSLIHISSPIPDRGRRRAAGSPPQGRRYPVPCSSSMARRAAQPRTSP